VRYKQGVRIYISEAITCRMGVWEADVFRAINYLPLRSGELHQIEIYNSQTTDTSSR